MVESADLAESAKSTTGFAKRWLADLAESTFWQSGKDSLQGPMQVGSTESAGLG